MSNQKQPFGERVYFLGLFECPQLSFQNGCVLTIVADLDKRLLSAGETRQKINFTCPLLIARLPVKPKRSPQILCLLSQLRDLHASA